MSRPDWPFWGRESHRIKSLRVFLKISRPIFNRLFRCWQHNSYCFTSDFYVSERIFSRFARGRGTINLLRVSLNFPGTKSNIPACFVVGSACFLIRFERKALSSKWISAQTAAILYNCSAIESMHDPPRKLSFPEQHLTINRSATVRALLTTIALSIFYWILMLYTNFSYRSFT